MNSRPLNPSMTGMARFRHVLFDFDGTLVDSSPGILSSFERTLAAHGVAPIFPLDRSLIGPPLAATLARITGFSDSKALQPLIDTFKTEYDSRSYLGTFAYAGVVETLAELAMLGVRVFIATNKRIAPTRKILAHLGWQEHIAGVYALDAVEPVAPNKAALVGEIIRREVIDIRSAVMVGDSPEDAHAAQTYGLPFFAALWGYGGLAQDMSNPAWRRLAQISELLDHARGGN